jgi:hypothetical protein
MEKVGCSHQEIHLQVVDTLAATYLGNSCDPKLQRYMQLEGVDLITFSCHSRLSHGCLPEEQSLSFVLVVNIVLGSC